MSIPTLDRLRALWAAPARRRGLLASLSGALIAFGLASKWLDGPQALTSFFWLAAAAAAGVDVAGRAFAALRRGAFSIELLVTIAAVGALFIGEYWESAAVTFLFVFGGYLEARTLARTRAELNKLIDLAPTEVSVLRDGDEVKVAPHEVRAGETVVVRPGGRIAVDGVILSGNAAIDESAITGEPMPPSKAEGDTVFAGTVSQDGYLEIRAETVGADTTIARIIQRVEEAQEAKAPTQRFIERFASWYTPAIVVLAAGTYLLTSDAVLALTLLVIACPGALVISTPISIIAGIGRSAREGILIKGGEHLEAAGRIRAVAFDKTGTLTVGRPEVSSRLPLAAVPPFPGLDGEANDQLLTWAAVAEGGSEHPLARAVLRAAPSSAPAADAFETHPGGGISARWQGREIEVGSPDWVRSRGAAWPAEAEAALNSVREKGESAAAIVVDGQVAGVLGFADRIRPEASEALQELRRVGIRRLVMLTGDHAASAERVAGKLGIGEVQASLLPEHKLEAIERIRRETGVTAMIGDGINDAPALMAADIGVAMGAAGTDLAVETADVALMADDLSKLPRAVELARATLLNIRQNVVIALATVVALLIGVFAGEVHMAGGMFVHQASVLIVVLNGMRLLRTGRPKPEPETVPAV